MWYPRSVLHKYVVLDSTRTQFIQSLCAYQGLPRIAGNLSLVVRQRPLPLRAYVSVHFSESHGAAKRR